MGAHWNWMPRFIRPCFVLQISSRVVQELLLSEAFNKRRKKNGSLVFYHSLAPVHSRALVWCSVVMPGVSLCIRFLLFTRCLACFYLIMWTQIKRLTALDAPSTALSACHWISEESKIDVVVGTGFQRGLITVSIL